MRILKDKMKMNILTFFLPVIILSVSIIIIFYHNQIASAQSNIENTFTLERIAEREEGILAIISYKGELHFVWSGEEIAGLKLQEKTGEKAVFKFEDEEYVLKENESFPAGGKNFADETAQRENRASREIDRDRVKYNSRGADVVFLQHILFQKGYLNTVPDGNFTEKTESALKSFQYDHGLNASGIADEETWYHLKNSNIFGLNDVEQTEKTDPEVKEDVRADVLIDQDEITSAEFELLARIIHGESRGQSYRGKVAVGAVVLNRVKNKNFPDTITEVIYEQDQFSPVEDGSYRLPPSQKSKQAAEDALEGEDPAGNALYFLNPEISEDYNWVENKEKITKIDDHEFFR